MLTLAIMLIIGMTVDFERVDNAKSRMQDAADAAVLATAREYINLLSTDMTQDERKAAAIEHGESIFNANLAADELMLDEVDIDLEIDPSTSSVTAKVNGDLPLAFGQLAGLDSQDILVNAAAIAGDARKLEIVLALDNSTSMFIDNRINLLRGAAKNFTDIIFDGSIDDEMVQIGVVPWGTTVNILSETPDAWDNSAGSTETPPNNGNGATPPNAADDRLDYLYRSGSYSGSYTTSELANAFAPVGWRGCIAATKNERQVSSSGAVTVNLTEDPPSPMKWPALLIASGIQTKSVKISYGAESGSAGCTNFDFYDTDGECGAPNYEPPAQTQCKTSNCYVPSCNQSYIDYWYTNYYMPAELACSNSSSKVTSSTLSECVSDPNEHKWWNEDEDHGACPGVTLSEWTSFSNNSDTTSGPNVNCPSAMLPMSQSRPQVYDKLNHIYPTPGGTHADLGLMWALRMLSPLNDWTDFWNYTEDTTPMDWDDTGVRKIVVLLSDGQNTSPSYTDGYYGCNGTRSTMSINKSSVDLGLEDCSKADGMKSISSTALDSLMIDSCTALKSNGVELYTIALDLDEKDSDEAEAIALLKECATSADYAYNISNSELNDVFSEIAQATLRLSK